MPLPRQGIRAPSLATVLAMKLDAALLDILACPACLSALRADEAADELDCTGCVLVYPVRDDIPVLLVDEARAPK